MTNKVKNYSNRTPYDGIAPNANEIIVPWVLTNEIKTLLKQQGYKSYQIETFHMLNGQSIKVFFMRINIEDYETYMKAYNEEISLYLTEERNAKSHFERQVFEDTEQPILSLDKIYDDLDNDEENSSDPTGTNAFEDREALIYLLNDLLDQIDDEKNCRIIKMLFEGYKKKEVCEAVLTDKGKTQAYEYIEKVKDFAREIFNSINN